MFEPPMPVPPSVSLPTPKVVRVLRLGWRPLRGDDLT
jgi:hypothetical protein